MLFTLDGIQTEIRNEYNEAVKAGRSPRHYSNGWLNHTIDQMLIPDEKAAMQLAVEFDHSFLTDIGVYSAIRIDDILDDAKDIYRETRPDFVAPPDYVPFLD